MKAFNGNFDALENLGYKKYNTYFQKKINAVCTIFISVPIGNIEIFVNMTNQIYDFLETFFDDTANDRICLKYNPYTIELEVVNGVLTQKDKDDIRYGGWNIFVINCMEFDILKSELQKIQ